MANRKMSKPRAVMKPATRKGSYGVKPKKPEPDDLPAKMKRQKRLKGVML